MRIYLILLILILGSCASRKPSNLSIVKYSFGEVGSYRYKIDRNLFAESINYLSLKKKTQSKIKKRDWNKISKEINLLQLDSLHRYESPTNQRALDGEWYTEIVIFTNNKKYKTPFYDSGYPNARFAKLDRLLDSIKRKYSKIKRESFYEKAYKEQQKGDEKFYIERVYPYPIVEIKPEFPGGNRKLAKFIETQKQFFKNKKKGKAWAYFVISEKGEINNLKVRADNNTLKQHTLKIIKAMPKWEAGLMHGKKVKVSYALGIEY